MARQIEWCSIDPLLQRTIDCITQVIQTQNQQSVANIDGKYECENNNENSIEDSLKLITVLKTTPGAAGLQEPTHRSALITPALTTQLVLKAIKKRMTAEFEKPSVPTAANFTISTDLYANKRLKLSSVNANALRLQELGTTNCVLPHFVAKTTAEDNSNTHRNNVGNDAVHYEGRNFDCVFVSIHSKQQKRLLINIDKRRMSNIFRLPQQTICDIVQLWPRGGGNTPILRLTSTAALGIKKVVIAAIVIPTAATLTALASVATTWRSKVGACMNSKTTTGVAMFATAVPTKTVCSRELLAQKLILESGITSTTAKRTTAPLITILRKPLTLTVAATKPNGILNLVQHACLVVAFFLTVLTLQHVNGQNIVSTAKFTAKTGNKMPAVATIIRTQAASAMKTLEISQIPRFIDKRSKYAHKIKKHKRYKYVTLVGLDSSQRRDSTKKLTSVHNKSTYVTPSEDNDEIIRTSQRVADNGREIKQNIVHHLNYAAMRIPKIEDAYSRDNSVIHYSKHIYDESNNNNLFNERSRKLKSVLTGSYEADMPKFDQMYEYERARGVFSVTSNIDSDITKATFDGAIDNNSFQTRMTDDVSMIMQSSQFEENQKLLKLAMDGLRLQQLPNMKKVNISQTEYMTKYREYLLRVHERKRRELDELVYMFQDPLKWEMENAPLHIVTIAPNATEFGQYSRRKRNILDDSDDSDYTEEDAVTEEETATDCFILPRKQRNHDGKTHRRQRGTTTMILRFSLERNAAQLQASDVEEANIRLMLIQSSRLAVKSNKQKTKSRNCACERNGTKHDKLNASTTASTKEKNVLKIKVYQRLRQGKPIWLDGRKVDIEVDLSSADDTHSQWLQFDVTKAVDTWLREEQSNLELEVQCDNCQRVGARILHDKSSSSNVDTNDPQLMPALNIIGRIGITHKQMRMNKHSISAETIYHHHNIPTLPNGRQRSNAALGKQICHKSKERCCRHTMEVVFKEIKGFEFILQPKVFDAGYCHGRCPPRYNPAHHHAILQSLIWKQNRERAPRLCCAPSKLVELEVLHVDEKDSEKLKISTWTDMRVVECACS